MEEKYTIAEDFELPSKALIYGTPFDYHVRLKSMTIRDEMKRTAPSSTVHKNLCEIIDSCLLTKLPLSVYDMCVGDYEYLLHKLRVTTYGPEYKIVVGCPHCKKVHEETANLDALKIKEFDPQVFASCLELTLPVCGKKVKLRIQTPRILDNIDTKVQEFKKKNPNIACDPTDLITLQEMIDTVEDNKLSYIELETFINNLSARDSNYIKNKIDKANLMIGLGNELDVTCKVCGGDIKTYFRFGPEFFRPTNDE